MCPQWIMRHQLLRHFRCQFPIATPRKIDRREFIAFHFLIRRKTLASSAKSASSMSFCELTDTYSAAAIAIAPATRPAKPARKMCPRDECAAATSSMRLAVETIPSSAPSTVARSHPVRYVPAKLLLRHGR
jgi:hypothetical protein